MKKVLLLFPNNYTLLDNFKNILEILGYELKHIDFNSLLSNSDKTLNKYLFKLPQKYKWKRIEQINNKVNQKYIEIFDDFKPDIVLTYNEQKLTKKTVQYFNSKAHTIFFLGDYPLFIHNRPDNLAAILEGKTILSPDSYWMEQMKIMGARNVHYFIPGFSEKLNYKINVSEDDINEWGSDIVFIGRQYHDTWGYKRAMFLDAFKDFNLKIYGDKSWYKWFNYFPELEQYFTLNKSYLPFETVNIIMNASKIYPIDANPGVINGLHVRIFDCIGSGILPLIEYRKDIDLVFKDVEIPFIKDFNNIQKLTKFWIKNDSLRINKNEELRQYIGETFSPDKLANQINALL
ncbi:MAG: hypothetical protein JXR60_08535 [Bacteroidales bacterium]|nr:hypothetical protein [Bacteroidales bacterium]